MWGEGQGIEDLDGREGEVKGKGEDLREFSGGERGGETQ